MEGLISRTLYWTHRLERPVKRWSLEEMEITHSWASNAQQCLYTKMLFRLHVWQFASSWTSLFQWRFRKGLRCKHLCSLHLWGWRVDVNWLHRRLKWHRWRNNFLGLSYLALRFSYVWLKPYRTPCLRNWKPCSGSTQWLFYVGISNLRNNTSWAECKKFECIQLLIRGGSVQATSAQPIFRHVACQQVN